MFRAVNTLCNLIQIGAYTTEFGVVISKISVPCIKEFGMTSDEFATRFLEEEKVAVVPGTAFGDCGEGFLRISYAYSIDNLKVAIGRLANFVERLRKEKA